MDRVNRIFGSGDIHNPAQTDFEGNSHLTNIRFTGLPNTTITGYGYWMDLSNDAGDANSNQTFGFSVLNKVSISDTLTMPLRGEFAYQEDAFDSPLDYGATYYHLSTGLEGERCSLTVGYESLGDDNGASFRTPLATGHAFNGYADKFLTTPPDGLSDVYISASTKLPGDIVFKPSFHWFGPADGGLDYGQEVDVVLVKKLSDNLTALVKYAHYFADEFAEDTDQITMQLGWTF